MKDIIEHFKTLGFILHESETGSDHFYMDKHKPVHIDIQGNIIKNSKSIKLYVRLIGRKHVEEEETFTISSVEDLKQIDNLIKRWETY